jgi:hypothetical protein
MAVMLAEGLRALLRHVADADRWVRLPMTLSSLKVDVLRPGTFPSKVDWVDWIPAERR